MGTILSLWAPSSGTTVESLGNLVLFFFVFNTNNLKCIRQKELSSGISQSVIIVRNEGHSMQGIGKKKIRISLTRIQREVGFSNCASG